MAIYARKKRTESNDALQQRFKKQVQKAELIRLLRSRARFIKKPTKRATRNTAVKREEYRDRNRKNQFYSNM